MLIRTVTLAKPVYIYSLKEGINDGFLTPFKVKRIKTTLDDYIYTSDDTVVEGDIEAGKLYEEKDFNRTIEIVAREAKRVNIYLDEANQSEKAIIFCANQPGTCSSNKRFGKPLLKKAKTRFIVCV